MAPGLVKLFKMSATLRLLRREPSFTAATVLTLTVGIGATTTIFSAVDAVLLQPPPFPDPNRLVTVWQTDPRRGDQLADVAPANFFDWHEQAESFEHLAALEPVSLDYTGGERPLTFLTGRATGGFFEALGVSAALGRTFLPDEHRPDAPAVVILSDALWKRRFGEDPTLIGQSLTLDGRPHMVVGVLRPLRRPMRATKSLGMRD